MLHVNTDKFLDYETEPTMRWETERFLASRFASKVYLNPFLGEEIVKSGKDGLRLVLHPGKVRGEVVREDDQVSRATDVHSYMKTQMGRDY